MKRTFDAFNDHRYGSRVRATPEDTLVDPLVNYDTDHNRYSTYNGISNDYSSSSVALTPGNLYGSHTPFPSQNTVVSESQPDRDYWIDFESQSSGLNSSGSSDLPDRIFDTCYGMLYRVNVRLLGDMSIITTYLSSCHGSAQKSFHLMLDIIRSEEGYLFICLPDATKIAEINKKETEVLSDLLREKVASLQAIIDKRVLQSTIKSATSAKHAMFAVNINVYGPNVTQPNTLDIGSHLSDHKLWLQRPAWQMEHTRYNNPHYFQIKGEPVETSIKLEDPEPTGRIGDLDSSITDVFSMLTRDAHLKQDSGDINSHRPLLPHQERALYFMTQREVGPLPEEFQSWEQVVYKDGKWFQHKIATKIKTMVQPPELGGGILADEMGMGKTFSTLALILSSLKRAKEWSVHHESKLNDDLPATIPLSHATLVVVPSPLLLRTWTEEVRKQITAPLDIEIYHGEKRIRDSRILMKKDIVITTYHTLVADYGRNNAVIRDIAWYRIVLDEAHFIRRSSSSLFKRVDEIHAKFRWCLTGTPIQNQLEDVATLFRFLKMSPFDRLGVFKVYISEPFRANSGGRPRAKKALVALLDLFSLRHSKALVELNNFEENVKIIKRTKPETDLYNRTWNDMTRSMRNTVNHQDADNKLGKFQVQLQLRLLCNHGTFQHQFHWLQDSSSRERDYQNAHEDFQARMEFGEDTFCSGCKETLGSHETETRVPYDVCQHIFCFSCQPKVEPECLLCMANSSRVARDKTKGLSDQHTALPEYFKADGRCAKMEQLRRDLEEVDPNDKSIVFTQWTTTLDLVAHHLRKAKIRFERVDGIYEFRHRQRILDQFNSDRDLPVLIMTLGVGANGLDLTIANRVYLVEPQWNPSVEKQAIGRTLRIGQKKRVTVTRYVTEESVEELIRNAQEHKLGMAAVSSTLLEKYPTDTMDHKE